MLSFEATRVNLWLYLAVPKQEIQIQIQAKSGTQNQGRRSEIVQSVQESCTHREFFQKAFLV